MALSLVRYVPLILNHAKVNNPETIGLFNSFAELLSFHVANIEKEVSKLKIA